MSRSAHPPPRPVCSKLMRFIVAEPIGCKFRCAAYRGDDPMRWPEVWDLFNGELQPRLFLNNEKTPDLGTIKFVQKGKFIIIGQEFNIQVVEQIYHSIANQLEAMCHAKYIPPLPPPFILVSRNTRISERRLWRFLPTRGT